MMNSLRFSSLSIVRGSMGKLVNHKPVHECHCYTMTLRDSSAKDVQPGGLYLERHPLSWGYIASYPTLSELSEELYQANQQPTEEAQTAKIEELLGKIVPALQRVFRTEFLTPKFSPERRAILEAAQPEILAALDSGYWDTLNDSSASPELYPEGEGTLAVRKSLFLGSDKLFPADYQRVKTQLQKLNKPVGFFERFCLKFGIFQSK